MQKRGSPQSLRTTHHLLGSPEGGPPQKDSLGVVGGGCKLRCEGNPGEGLPPITPRVTESTVPTGVGLFLHPGGQWDSCCCTVMGLSPLSPFSGQQPPLSWELSVVLLICPEDAQVPGSLGFGRPRWQEVCSAVLPLPTLPPFLKSPLSGGWGGGLPAISPPCSLSLATGRGHLGILLL